MYQRSVAEVVEASFFEDQATSLEPCGLGLWQNFRDDASQSTHHGPSSMNELCSRQNSNTHDQSSAVVVQNSIYYSSASPSPTDLPVASEGLRVCRETCRVPSVISWELALEIRRDGTIGVWTKPLWAIWAVPLNWASANFLSCISNHSSHDLRLCSCQSPIPIPIPIPPTNLSCGPGDRDCARCCNGERHGL